MFNFLSNIFTCVIVGAYYSYKALLLIYRLCLFLVEVIDKIVEAIMTRTIYRLTDSQKKVLMHVFIFVGLAVNAELQRIN